MNRLITIVLSILLVASLLSCQGSEIKPQITQCTIHFVDWYMLTRYSWSCEEVNRNGDSVCVSDSATLNQLVHALDTIQLSVLEDYDGVDARVCLLFFDKASNVVLQVSIGKPGTMQIRETVYDLDPEFWALTTALLPKDYLNQPM